MNEAPARSLAASMDCFTASAVSGSPSWNFTSGRSLKVQVRPSSLDSQLSANMGVKRSAAPGGLMRSSGS